MWVWWGTRIKERPTNSGFFTCGKCKTSQPCNQITVEKVSHICSIPLERQLAMSTSVARPVKGHFQLGNMGKHPRAGLGSSNHGLALI
jgi:hypothetical protein